MAVWHTKDGEESVRIPMRGFEHAQVIYPKAAPACARSEDGEVVVTLRGIGARLLRLF